ncbi:MAG: MATE family efflux transporter [Nitrospirae bacterium]|nr:MATE family efflux transporter [Nitrospirota bacterium]
MSRRRGSFLSSIFHTGRVRRHIAALAWPAVLSHLFLRLGGILDVFLVGRLGASAIAGVGVGQLHVFLWTTALWGISAGTTVVTAHLRGAKDPDRAAGIAGRLLAGGIGIAAVLAILGLLGRTWVARLMGAAPDVVGLAAAYLGLLFLFFPVTAALSVLAAVFHGAGNTRVPLIAYAGANLLHVAIAIPLIYGVGTVEPMGVRGAALAVVLSDGAAAAFLFVLALKGGLIRWRGGSGGMIRETFRVGLPVFFDRLLQQVGQMTYAKIVLLYGTSVYAAHQVGLAIEAFSFMPALGAGLAVTTLVGQALGGGRARRANAVMREGAWLAVAFMALMGAVFFAVPGPLIRAFTDDPGVLEPGILYLRIVALLQVPLALTLLLAAALRGSGDTRYNLVVTIGGMWGVRIPAAAAAAFAGAPIAAVWSAMIVDWTVRTVLIVRRLSRRGLVAKVSLGMPGRGGER